MSISPAFAERASPGPEVERELRERILSLEIGPGERLTERWGEGRPGASRSPVRAALFRLEAEGLVRRAGKGWIVAPIDLDELEQLFVYREVLEVAAIRHTVATLDGDALTGIDDLLGTREPGSTRDEALHAGHEFHVRLAQLSGNTFISRGVADAMTRLSRARWLESSPRHHGWDEHRAIVAAMQAGDGDRAASLLGTHISESRERLLAVLRENRRRLGRRSIDAH